MYKLEPNNTINQHKKQQRRRRKRKKEKKKKDSVPLGFINEECGNSGSNTQRATRFILKCTVASTHTNKDQTSVLRRALIGRIV